MQQQDGSRKRRKLSSEPAQRAPAPTLSRVKAKGREVKQLTAEPTEPAEVSKDRKSTEKVTFGSIDVAPWLVASLSTMEIKYPTGIQKACIPEILKGRDCIGGSRTGTGKTIAFSVPILQKWAEDPCGIFALIIT